MNEKWYEFTPEQIASKLGSDISRGISASAAAERLKTNGDNRIYTESQSIYKNNLSHIMTDLTVLLLIFTAVISTAFNQNISAIVIICIILINITAAVTSSLCQSRQRWKDDFYRQRSSCLRRYYISFRR